jgi:hypothetical protein
MKEPLMIDDQIILFGEGNLPPEKQAALERMEAIFRADEAAKVWEEAANVCRALHSSIDYEIGHGKDMGERGAGYQEACDDIEAHCVELRAKIGAEHD